jgi:hypothetical protein
VRRPFDDGETIIDEAFVLPIDQGVLLCNFLWRFLVSLEQACYTVMQVFSDQLVVNDKMTIAD